MKTIAVIPAKMTSVRLPRKNMADLCGHPLLYYSIAAAKQVKEIDEIYVSSEDKDVLAFAEKEGVVPLPRPEHLSLPDVTTKDVLRHVYESNNILSNTFCVLLQPTHPLRFPSDISEAVHAMKTHERFDSLFTVVKTDELRGTIENDLFVPEFPLPRVKSREPVMYRNTGSFYIFRPEKTFLTQSFFGEHIYPYILANSLFEVDIDNQSDLELARLILMTYRDKFSHF
jgi:CMP-N-acetylneuraminic acid synthetase